MERSQNSLRYKICITFQIERWIFQYQNYLLKQSETSIINQIINEQNYKHQHQYQEQMRLEKLLNIQKQNPEIQLYQFLPVKTSLSQELLATSQQVFNNHYQFSKKNILKSQQKPKPKWEEFIPNVDTEDAKNDLVMLKLRGLIDQTKFSRSTDMKKLPKKVQKGEISGGGGFQEVRRKKGKKHNSIVESLLQFDQQMGYSSRRFIDIQKQKQLRKRITKKSILKGNKKFQKGSRSNYE